jgi:hypothetical protein
MPIRTTTPTTTTTTSACFHSHTPDSKLGKHSQQNQIHKVHEHMHIARLVRKGLDRFVDRPHRVGAEEDLSCWSCSHK